ncbi:accessory Sec system protein Asp1 [Staphylococcus aureus]
MKYFIPAWYDDQQWWQDTTVPYYHALENELDYHLIVLNHAPNIRTFLHRYDLYETKYWSVFDEIQGFSHHAPQAINYHLLKWPDDVEFVYTPYLLKCVTSEQAYTNIYFSQEGYSIWFEEFERDQLQRRYIFDDRGYLSAIRYFDKDGEASYQEYLTINVDRQLERELLTHQDHHQRQNSMIRITPFETRQSPNISSQLMETFIGVWIDGMSDADLQQMMQRLVDYITQEDYYRLILLTRHQNDIPMWLRECITSVNEEYQSKQNADVNVSALMTPEDQDDIIAVKTIHAEHDVVEALRTLRLVIDMSKEPDLYLQISAISAGIPQINGQQTDYVSDYDNGRIINTVDELEDALNYYLFYLKNWNYAYAYSLKLIDAYASKNIINQLDELIEGENNAT